MHIESVPITEENLLSIDKFRELDHYAVTEYELPIELMMENAGLQLARLIANHASKENKILIGVGNGNNGGGGLVAARRLLAWGYDVYLDQWANVDKELPLKQLERALVFGLKESRGLEFDIWIDAYLGFSQRLPLPRELEDRIERAKEFYGLKISLDLPVGFSKQNHLQGFPADIILTLAAPKEELRILRKAQIYVADLGIPLQVYKRFSRSMLPFEKNGMLEAQPSVYRHEHLNSIANLHEKTVKILSVGGSLMRYLTSYANDLFEGFHAELPGVAKELSNYYKPMIGLTAKEIFRFDLTKADYMNAAAACHGFERIEDVRDQQINADFEQAVNLLLAGDYFRLKQKLADQPDLINRHSQFGHKAKLIHYCASNAVEFYRQVVPFNLREMIGLLLDVGADPHAKIPVYGGEFNFFELFETSAHPKDSGKYDEIIALMDDKI